MKPFGIILFNNTEFYHQNRAQNTSNREASDCTIDCTKGKDQRPVVLAEQACSKNYFLFYQFSIQLEADVAQNYVIENIYGFLQHH